MESFQKYLKSTNQTLPTFTKLIKSAGNAFKGFAATLGSMATMWAIIEAISFVITGIDKLANSAKYCAERVDNLMTSYKSSLTSANQTAARIEEIAGRYETLSKGVNNLGHNLSLTNDEYSEYNSLVNEIANMFPTLIQGYTAEGNAILNLKDDVEGLRDAYKGAQQEAYKLLTDDSDDIIEHFRNVYIGYDGILAWGENWGNSAKIDYLAKITKSSDTIYGLLDLFDKSEKSARDSKWFIEFTGLSSIEDIEKLKPEDLAKIKEQANLLTRQFQAEINEALGNVELLANAYLNTIENYQEMDSSLQNIASILVNNLDEYIAEQFDTSLDVGLYVTGLVKDISENTDLQDALTNLFSIDMSDLSIDEAYNLINNQIKIIANLLEEDENKLKIRLGFDTYDELYSNYTEILETISKKSLGLSANQRVFGFKRLEYSDIYNQIDKFATEYSINTQDEIAAFSKAFEDANYEIDKAFQKYLEQLPNSGENTSNVSDSLDQTIDKYKELLDIISGNSTLINSQIDLLASRGETVGQALYDELLNQFNQKYTLLIRQYKSLKSDLANAMSNGIEKGSNEWLDMNNSILEVLNSITNTKAEIVDIQNTIDQLHWNSFDKIKEAIENISNEAGNLANLLKGDTLLGSNGKLTNKSLTQLALYAEQLEAAKYLINQYSS